jgi:hypothetical protein
MGVEASDIAKKYRRALRNGQGTRFTAEELERLAEIGLLVMLQNAEADELRKRCAERSGNMSSATIGSTSDRNRRSTKSAGTTRKAELRGIEALVANG